MNNLKKKPVIGFIGQGYVGKHYADNFEKRGFPIVRYSLEDEHIGNKNAIALCDFVFIAVPTPTTTRGFDGSIARSALSLISKGKIAIIKSTLAPGTTEKLQMEFRNIFIFHSPEFLSERTAPHEVAHPHENIIGIPIFNKTQKKIAKRIIKILPIAPYNLICSSTEAEIIKYGHNCLGYTRIVFTNILYDLADKLGCDWEKIQEAMSVDPVIGPTYMNPIHKNGRGAGGNCFIKDFSAFIKSYRKLLNGDLYGIRVLKAIERKNIELLKSTEKDVSIIKSVYGKK